MYLRFSFNQGISRIRVMKEVIIEVQSLTKNFGAKKVHTGVSFELHNGECLGLIGGSGVGKSVVLRSLIGLERPDSGQIIIDGEDITGLDESSLVHVRKRVAYCFQNGALFDSMTVYENLSYPLKEHTKMSDTEIAKSVQVLLERFGLQGNDHLYPSSLSGGMQKRLGIARAIILQPEVILYDEPTAGLDPYNTRKMNEMIIELKKTGVSSIVVTHDMPSAFQVCDRFAVLIEGKIAEIGTREQLLAESNSLLNRFVHGEAH